MSDPYADWYAMQRRICQQVAIDKVMAAHEARQVEVRAAARERDRQTQLDGAIREAVDVMNRAPVEGLRQLVDVLCQKHRITVEWTDGAAVPGEATAYANWTARKITTPRIRTVADGATALHEIGHVLQGVCPGVEPHRPKSVAGHSPSGGWHNCLACERDACERALRLAPLSKEMHDNLAKGLGRYLTKMSASWEERQRARRFISGATWREATHARVEREIRLEKYREMQRWAEEATHAHHK